MPTFFGKLTPLTAEAICNVFHLYIMALSIILLLSEHSQKHWQGCYYMVSIFKLNVCNHSYIIMNVQFQVSPCKLFPNSCWSTMCSEIPLDARNQLLPDLSLSIIQLLSFPFPPISLSHSGLVIDEYIFHNAPNTNDIETIQSLVVSSPTIIKNLATDPKVNTGQYQSIRLPHLLHITSDTHFPLWIVQYWAAVIDLWQICSKWTKAEGQLQAQRKPRRKTLVLLVTIINKVYGMMTCISWSGNLHGFSVQVPISFLTTYATKDWLTNKHEAQMLELLNGDLLQSVMICLFLFFHLFTSCAPSHGPQSVSLSIAAQCLIVTICCCAMPHL